MRHFNVIGYTPMQDESLELIFSTILVNYLETQKYSDEAWAENGW